MRIKSFITFFLAFFFSYVIGQIETVFTLKTETGNLEGSLLIPETKERIPIALIIAGSGPTDRNGNNPMMTNNSLKMLASGLTENGIATLRYDKRGVGKSISAWTKEFDLRFETYINDVKHWIDLLKKDKRFSEIIVIGHSEGSLIGIIASQQTEVAKFVSIAGIGESAGNLIRNQLKDQPKFILDQSLPIIDKLEKGDTVNKVPPFLFSLFRPSVQPYIISWFKYDPQKEIAKLEIPILIIQGTTDIQVKVEDAEALAKSKPNAEKYILNGMNHILKEVELDKTKNIATYNNPELPLKDGLIEILVNFIKK
jgi:pimeloyl-ACP methyl ester carboxylesterase